MSQRFTEEFKNMLSNKLLTKVIRWQASLIGWPLLVVRCTTG
jgi:hypothetical protein